MGNVRKSYQPPKLEKFGSVGKLTLVGLTHPGSDARGGSVNPPGHSKKPL